ncbi:hypothetical protein O181_062199 [Austropuccinia psidii MF-1]|uniref:Uncharacterized protein n=1 Tax=Austropuccinia psidii MF-1 TaxID=1389203 RepID=A0A9Q3EJX5_9BASI|nr:hypothetical protein [Austropuccinia psidii MF-1]
MRPQKFLYWCPFIHITNYGRRRAIHPGRNRAKKIRIFFRSFWHFSGLSKTSLKGIGEDGEEEESYGTEVVLITVGVSEGTGGLTLSQSNNPFYQKYDPSFLDIMQQIAQIMANLQAASSSEALRPPVFNNPSMKAPD